MLHSIFFNGRPGLRLPANRQTQCAQGGGWDPLGRLQRSITQGLNPEQREPQQVEVEEPPPPPAAPTPAAPPAPTVPPVPPAPTPPEIQPPELTQPAATMPIDTQAATESAPQEPPSGVGEDQPSTNGQAPEESEAAPASLVPEGQTQIQQDQMSTKVSNIMTWLNAADKLRDDAESKRADAQEVQARLEAELASTLEASGFDIARLAAREVLASMAEMRDQLAEQRRELRSLRTELDRITPYTTLLSRLPGMVDSIEDGDVCLRVVWADFDDYMRKHVEAGRGGLLDLLEVPTWRIPLNVSVGYMLHKFNSETGGQKALSEAMFCTWSQRVDGSVRPTLPWRAVLATDDNTAVRSWLADWLRDAPITSEGVPVLSLWCSRENDTAWKEVFIKAYLPREGRMKFERWWFKDYSDSSAMLEFLRVCAGLPEEGGPEDIYLWTEGGPNERCTWNDLVIDWSRPTCGELQVGHGDVLVVQEHPDRLGGNLEYPKTAPKYIRRRAFRQM